ncbi:GGDEF domain-containing protein [Rheinheimera maricola]|uniref:diguanylate cyclase n=1 Tax=Rheinheimera maricola TaxID=2793282 RepID=A0ABS7X7V7_9GAMM|nr:GGDEF domain-containing protein [Rheinheimera maricola]MBZ9611635.1 GGDEF domain-containing protein [Rheinheimera maricola]
MSVSSTEQQLLVFIMLLTGVSTIAWLILSRLMRIAPVASLRFSAANMLLFVGVAMLFLRQVDSSLLFWLGADLLALLAFVALKAGFLALFKHPSAIKTDLGLLLLWSILALQVPDNAKEHWLGLLFSAFAFISLASSTTILYQASANSFKKRYAAAVAAPLAGISLLFLLRFLTSLFIEQQDTPVVHQGKSELYWAYLVFVLLVNITIFSSTLVRLVAKIRHLADRDQLTGLYNRFALNRKLMQLQHLHMRHQQPYAILLFDLDHFKRINDRFGHLAGDKALKHAANLLSSNIRSEDVLGRFGGEEFLLLLPMTERPMAEQVAAKLLAVLHQHPLQLNDNTLQLTSSIGIAVAGLENPAASSEVLLQQADQALYQAKDNGRDQINTYTAPTDTGLKTTIS